MGQTSDCVIQRTLRSSGVWLSRLLTAETAVRSLGRPCEICSGYSDTGTGLLWVLLPPPRQSSRPMIQVNSSFNKMINGTSNFAVPARRFNLPREEQEKILQRTLHMRQGCAFWSHERTVVKGICFASGSTDLSVGTDNCLKREEYSDYKRVLQTFMILLTSNDVVCQKVHTPNTGNYHYLVVCCHRLWQIITQSTWCCSLFLKS